MLIVCPECEGKVSDKALTCPHCGFPLKQQPRVYEKKRNFRKLPNRFGSIQKLSGNRRKPYVAYPAATEFNNHGSVINRKALGYFETYNEAYLALSEYNKDPYDIDKRSATFAEVYDLFFEHKYGENAKKKLSESSKNATVFGYNKLSAIHNIPINRITIDMLQNIIDSSTMSHSTLEHMVHTAKGVFKFAESRDIISKNCASFLSINIEDDDEKGCPYSEEELAVLWKHTDNQTARITLILIYTGFRISELETISIEDGCFIGGLKTENGRNRAVPIHPFIKDWLSDLDDFSAKKWRKNCYYPYMKSLGMETASSGARHTPHDCRHTFSWLADQANMEKLSKAMIMGHSLGTNIEENTYGHRTHEELITEMNKITNKGKSAAPAKQ